MLPYSTVYIPEMEELAKHIILREILAPSFSSIQWNQLKSEPPPTYLQKMQIIYSQLLRHPTLKQKYFKRFQRNHLTLYGWYLVAESGRMEMQQYLFRPLLQRTPTFQNQKLNSAIASSPQQRPYRTQRAKRIQPHPTGDDSGDSHDLFVKTFAACMGSSYTCYDYERHMQGSEERSGYNNFIRIAHNRTESAPRHSKHPLERFEEWKRHREKASLLTFRQVLQDTNLNSERGLHKKLMKEGTEKLVIRNHQGKPINYYLKKQKISKKY